MENIVYVGLESQNPHRTCCLRIEYRGDFPQDLEIVLKSAGWTRDEFAPVPPFDGVAELNFVKDGTAIFNGWTDEEYTKNMRDVKKILKTFGLNPVRRKLTLADCL